MTTRRNALVLAAMLPWLPRPACAQARPGAEALARMTQRALADPQQTPFARPQVLGFGDQRVVTHQITQTRGGIEYFFAVTNPRLRDGLIFFSNETARRIFRMHRTDTHVRRITSATNALDVGNGGLQSWDGPQADADFAAQLAAWATWK